VCRKYTQHLLIGFLFWLVPVILQTVLISSSCLAASDDAAISGMDLTQLSLDELMKIEVFVTSVSKKPQALFQTPSAVYVLTTEDIRRSGATNIPDLLRLVPGIQVSRINMNKWAITSRGFNGRFATKLLMLIDGRNVYSPLFSGVYWDAQDTLIEDIERIEVIRGPGGSLWGTNAVNGIINIITKHSADTQGGLISAGGGNEERAFGEVRYGGKIDDGRTYRIYAKGFEREEGWRTESTQRDDQWQSERAGFRSDMSLSSQNELMLQGDFYHQHADELLAVPQLTPPYSVSTPDTFEGNGGFLLAKWHRRRANTSDISFQTYYDYTSRSNLRLKETRHTLDADFQYRFMPIDHHEIVWGMGYRCSWDDMSPTGFFSFNPRHAALQSPSAFIQDAISLVPELLVFNIGTKVEYNNYTGIEFQPSVQLLMTPSNNHAIWMAVTRAVRTPDRIESDSIHNPVVFPKRTPMQLRVLGTDDIEPETVISYELGYRTHLSERCLLDLALFYSDYDQLRSFENGEAFYEPLPNPPHLVLPVYIENLTEGESYGIEAALDVTLSDHWRLRTAYSNVELKLTPKKGSTDYRTKDAEGYTPHHQFTIRSLLDVTENIEWDFTVRFIDALPTFGIDSYWTADTRISWRLFTQLELSVIAQNLFDNRHPEWSIDRDNWAPTEVERSVLAKISWKF
jgi:iron complex outermembrane recepter protein